jgi:hypothetical protein
MNNSLSKALLFFYLCIAGSYTKDLYSGQLKDFIKDNRLIQHLIGLITMTIIIIEYGNMDICNSIIYSIISYCWFILTTKLDLHWNLIIIGLLLIGFLYESKLFNKDVQVNNDKVLDDKNKQKILNRNKNIRTIIFISIFGITLIGSYFYYNKKKVQYGGSYNDIQFLLY